MTGLIGRKLGMTRVFDAEGTHVPVTVIEAGPCPVVQVGQSQVQLGFGTKKPTRTAKALAGHVKKAGLETAPRVLESFPVAGERSEEHTSELQSQSNLVCRLLLEKKKKQTKTDWRDHT